MRCSQCGATDLEPGWLPEWGQDGGYTRWVAGALKLGVLGRAKIFRRKKLTVSAFRCQRCSHLELFAN